MLFRWNAFAMASRWLFGDKNTCKMTVTIRKESAWTDRIVPAVFVMVFVLGLVKFLPTDVSV